MKFAIAALIGLASAIKIREEPQQPQKPEQKPEDKPEAPSATDALGVTEEELNEALEWIFDEVDADDSGLISKQEAADAMAAVDEWLGLELDEDDMAYLEDEFDAAAELEDDDGELNKEEAKALIDSVWEDHSDVFIEALADISVAKLEAEWDAWCAENGCDDDDVTAAQTSSPGDVLDMEEDEIEAVLSWVFGKIDTSDDGNIDMDEASDALDWLEEYIKLPKDIKDDLTSGFLEFAGDDKVMDGDEALAAAEAAWEKYSDDIIGLIEKHGDDLKKAYCAENDCE